MAKSRITKKSVDEMAAPATGASRTYLWDDRLVGFGVMATQSGIKSYIVQYRIGGRSGPTRRVTIGRHGAPWTAEKARDRAADILEQVRKKIDPFEVDRAQLEAAKAAKAAIRETENAKRDREQLAFSAYVERFFERYAKVRQKPRTSYETRCIIDRDLKPHFNDKSIASITPGDILALVDSVYERSPSAALKAYRTLSTFFGWAASRHDITQNPMAHLKPPYVQPSRDRVLSDDELVAVWLAAGATPYPYGALVQLLVLTGQRLQEVAGMQWDEIDLAQRIWTVPGSRTKNGRPSLVPLADAALSLLEHVPRHGRYILTTTGTASFSGFSKAKARLDPIVGSMLSKISPGHAVVPWRLHDLRRTLATGLQRLGVRLEVTEAVLNHVSGSRAGIVGIYQRYDYGNEKRDALSGWAEKVSALVAIATAAIEQKCDQSRLMPHEAAA